MIMHGITQIAPRVLMRRFESKVDNAAGKCENKRSEVRIYPQ
jgi:hypothetical protein